MSQTHTEEKEEKEDSLSESPSTINDNNTNNNDNKKSIKRQKLEVSPPFTSSKKKKPPNLSLSMSQSANNLLSTNYNPSHNSKKDEIVQNASIKILEVESLLDKLNDHIDKHHRKSSQKLQDFEQVKI